jgi:hypothetical protein
MDMHESNPPAGRALTPEEVGARVSAILEAAERDARAVIEAAHRELEAPRREPLTLEELSREVVDLSARVAALERALPAAAAVAGPSPVVRDGMLAGARTDDEPVAPRAADASQERRLQRETVVPAARVRAIELALAGYSRPAIARELTASLSAAEIEGLLDEVLVG